MGDFGNCVNVRNITVGIAKRFDKNCFCIFFYCRSNFLQIMDVSESSFDSILGKRVCQQVIAAAINCFLRNDMIAFLCQRLNSVSYGSCAGGQR